MKAKLLGFVVLLLSFHSVLAQGKPAIPDADRLRIAEAFKLSKIVGDHLWKGWSKTPFAIMLVTSDYEFLMRHPNPSSDFTSLGYDQLLKTNMYLSETHLSSRPAGDISRGSRQPDSYNRSGASRTNPQVVH